MAGDLLAEQTNTLITQLSTAAQVAQERLARAEAAERMVEAQRESFMVIKQLLDHQSAGK